MILLRALKKIETALNWIDCSSRRGDVHLERALLLWKIRSPATQRENGFPWQRGGAWPTHRKVSPLKMGRTLIWCFKELISYISYYTYMCWMPKSCMLFCQLSLAWLNSCVRELMKSCADCVGKLAPAYSRLYGRRQSCPASFHDQRSTLARQASLVIPLLWKTTMSTLK